MHPLDAIHIQAVSLIPPEHLAHAKTPAAREHLVKVFVEGLGDNPAETILNHHLAIQKELAAKGQTFSPERVNHIKLITAGAVEDMAQTSGKKAPVIIKGLKRSLAALGIDSKEVTKLATDETHYMAELKQHWPKLHEALTTLETHEAASEQILLELFPAHIRQKLAESDSILAKQFSALAFSNRADAIAHITHVARHHGAVFTKAEIVKIQSAIAKEIRNAKPANLEDAVNAYKPFLEPIGFDMNAIMAEVNPAPATHVTSASYERGAVKEAAKEATRTERKIWQIATHDMHGVFSGERAAISAAITAAVAVSVGLLKHQQNTRDEQQHRTR